MHDTKNGALHVCRNLERKTRDRGGLIVSFGVRDARTGNQWVHGLKERLRATLHDPAVVIHNSLTACKSGKLLNRP